MQGDTRTDPTNQQPIALRAPQHVMRLSRLGSFHQSRLSFMRVLTRRMARESWRFEVTAFEIDATGVGHAVYTVHTPRGSYSLIAFAHDLPAEKRSDRVIATAWDATFTLFDGVPTAADISRLRGNIPLQEAGRVHQTELTVSRANRSVRLWEHVVSRLAAGQQPDRVEIEAVGYLMRTTAVYGSGKLGAADREAIAARPEFSSPFQAEMLTVFLIRTFVRDLVNHMARLRGGTNAVSLDQALARALGMGNSTGLGMAPFLLNHPVLFHNWINAREAAIARVRSLARAETAELAVFVDLVRRAAQSATMWRSDHPIQQAKLTDLRADFAAILQLLDTVALTGDHPWDGLALWAEATLTPEGQEALLSLMIEPYGALVDDLVGGMSADEGAAFRIDGAMTIGTLKAAIAQGYDWALAVDWDAPGATARAWYVSEEKLEPRLGERHTEPIEAYEQPLSPGRDVARVSVALTAWADETPLAEFLLRHPEHRHSVRRIQIVARHPYAEIRDNTVCATLLPIDMLRCKLSFFGAGHFDPRSDRWVRICMFGGAPYPEDLAHETADFWPYPALDGG